jgi:hypothetical protein
MQNTRSASSVIFCRWESLAGLRISMRYRKAGEAEHKIWITYIEEGIEHLEKSYNAHGLNNCGCNKSIVGEEVRCSIFKADVERRLVCSVIAKARYRRCSWRRDERRGYDFIRKSFPESISRSESESALCVSQEFNLGEEEMDFISFVPRGANLKEYFLVREDRSLKEDILKSIL